MTSREPPCKDALDWIQFAYMEDNEGGYAAPANITLPFSSPVERESTLLPALECLRTLYPEAYDWGDTSMSDLYGPEATREGSWS